MNKAPANAGFGEGQCTCIGYCSCVQLIFVGMCMSTPKPVLAIKDEC